MKKNIENTFCCIIFATVIITYFVMLHMADVNIKNVSASTELTVYEAHGTYDGKTFTCYGTDEQPSLDGQMFDVELKTLGYQTLMICDNGTPYYYADDYPIG